MDKFIKGFYRDLLSAPHGEVLWDSGWRSNKIVRSCNLILAALMKRDEGMAGILYWAVGEGEGFGTQVVPPLYQQPLG